MSVVSEFGPVHKISCDEFQQMIEAGVYGPEDHIELLDGAIVEMSPASPEHNHVLGILLRFFSHSLPEEYWLQPQSSVVAGRYSMPEPDLAIRSGPGRWEAHSSGSEILLAIEVALSSLSRDRRKAKVYAAAGVQEYWIVDVEGRRLELHTEPGPEGYRRIQSIDEFGEVAPAFARDARIPLISILPPKRGPAKSRRKSGVSRIPSAGQTSELP